VQAKGYFFFFSERRAEFSNEEFISVTDSVLENIIIIKKNPNYEPED